jgi:putative aminopeptidase FrvX
MTDIFTINGQPIPVPDGDVTVKLTDIQGDAVRDRSGMLHRTVLRRGVTAWEFSYERLTDEERRCLLELLNREPVFRFCHPGQPDGTRCYCKGTAARYHDAARGLLFGKAFDCRIGCAAMLEALHRLEGRELPCDVVAVLSTQEEVGHRGSQVAIHNVKPDIAIVMEGCPADDTFTEPYAIQTALGKGPMFRHMDVSVICAPRYQRWALDLAAKKGIPVQESVREGGGNNAATVQMTLSGAPAIVAGVPVRYAHSTDCISTEFDFEATVQMVIALLENIDADVIRGM